MQIDEAMDSWEEDRSLVVVVVAVVNDGFAGMWWWPTVDAAVVVLGLVAVESVAGKWS